MLLTGLMLGVGWVAFATRYLTHRAPARPLQAQSTRRAVRRTMAQ